MQIQVSPVSQVPIYEQIKIQIREEILSGRLEAGVQMPSLRGLARELRVGVITTKRAYEDLVEEGYLKSHGGRGFFVAALDRTAVRHAMEDQILEQLRDVLTEASQHGFTGEDVRTLMEALLEEGNR